IDKSFLKRLDWDADGYLYKAEQFEFQRYDGAIRRASESGYDEKAFEQHLEIRGAEDHEKLVAMLNDVNDDSIPINATIAKHFDRANFITWFALNVLTDNLDTNSQNFYLYAPSGSGPWKFLPWDYD